MRASEAMQVPHYRLPRRVIFELGPDMLLARRRSFAGDCAAMVSRMRPPPVVEGSSHIPESGSFVLVANHFEAPGLWIGWAAALLTDAVARARGGDPPVHWLVIGAMDRGRVDGLKRFAPSTGWVFARVANAWGMVTIPRPEAPSAMRAAALRRLIRLAAPPPAGADEPVAIFPEGEGAGLAGLRPALPGTGRLLSLLGRNGVPALPAGVWLEGKRLRARFGAAWLCSSADDADARREVMDRIGALLPEHMRAAQSNRTEIPQG